MAHWGDIKPKDSDSNIYDVTADIEQAMSPQYLEQNSEDQMEYLELGHMNPLIMYAIKLHKHSNDMRDMIVSAEDAIQAGVLPAASIPIPEMQDLDIKHKCNSLGYMDTSDSDFVLGKEETYPEIRDAIAKQVLMKCVATMLAHIGFETTENSVLLMLTDLLQMFLKKMCTKLKAEKEFEMKEGLGGFASYPDKVLIELGLGGMVGLHEYYQNRILKYINILRQRSQQLINEYETYIQQKQLTTNVNIKQESQLDILAENGAEMHISSIDPNVGIPSLDIGYQLLNSLEADSLIQHLE